MTVTWALVVVATVKGFGFWSVTAAGVLTVTLLTVRPPLWMVLVTVAVAVTAGSLIRHVTAPPAEVEGGVTV